MQSLIPGAEIVQTTGMPGGGFTVKIRGQNSIANGNDPFYIVDGVPYLSSSLGGSRDGFSTTRGANPLASINPNDIESIEVLKDGDATAIYGSRGANGVVLITTKRGQQGKAKISIAATQGIAWVGKKLNLMSASEYMAIREEALSNDGLPVSATDFDLNGTWERNRETDWQQELIGGKAPTTNIQASLSGGTNNITYLLSGNFYREGTVFPGSSSYGRNSGNFSLGYNSDNKRFQAKFDAFYSAIQSNLFLEDLTGYIYLPPNYPGLVNETGQLNWGMNAEGEATMYLNPLANQEQPFDASTKSLISNASISYRIISGLSVKASFGYTNTIREERSGQPLRTFSPALGYGADRRRSYFADNGSDSWIFEGQADYSKEFGSGKLNMLLGTTFQNTESQLQGIRASGYSSDELMGSLSTASTFVVEAGNNTQYRYAALFARINYTIADKYILNVTGRRDGSSRFGNENTFANFGAIGAAWIISDEPFIKNKLPLLSFAKLRGSYGITGNDQIPDYGYLDIWNPRSPYQSMTSFAPLRLKNPDYGWETTRKAEAGIEIGLFHDRIFTRAGYYHNKSENQLLPMQLPPSTGFRNIAGNLPAIVSNYGWEFDFSSKNLVKNSLTWSTSFNLTIPKNKLLEYPGLETSSDANRYVTGYPLTIQKRYDTTVDPETGIYTVRDYDQNGTINADDQYIITFVGRKFYGGLNNTFTAGNFQLDFLVQFVRQTGNSVFSGLTMPGLFQAQGPLSNQLSLFDNRWKNNGDQSEFQKYTTAISSYTAYQNAASRGSHALSDNSFIRLKNISVSYTLPPALSEKIHLDQVRIFSQAQNLFTITGYKGLDPETQSMYNLPQLRSLTLGVQATF